MPALGKQLLIAAICVGLSIMVGYWVSVSDYLPLLGIVGLVLAAATVLIPGYSFLLAFGLLCPFVLPLPFFYSFPTIAIFIGAICFKQVFRGSLSTNQQKQPRIQVWNLSMVLFFGWVFLRYCKNPVMPGLALGLSANISGFRFYMDYAVCAFLCFLLGVVVTDRKSALKLVWWLQWISIFFILLLVPLAFTKSANVGDLLTQLGMYVTLFDNGMLRFVVLPVFGVILVALALLPDLSTKRKFWRFILMKMGLIAVVVSGTRSGLAMAMAVIIAIPFIKRQYARFATIIGASVLAFCAVYFLGQNLNLRGNVGLLRVLSIANPEIAETSDAAATAEWRKIRWNRAIEEIKQSPVFGRGYGGLENVIMHYNTYEQFEDAQLEMDIATGGIHNGYLAAALTLGLPAAVLFIIILSGGLRSNLLNARRYLEKDPQLSDLHCFVFGILIANAVTIYIGTDVNGPTVWFPLAFGVVLSKIRPGRVDNQKSAKSPADLYSTDPSFASA